MAIEKVIIQNFKKFKNPFEVKFNENINLLVGDNESGKSTILEAIHVALTGMYAGRNITQSLFLEVQSAVHFSLMPGIPQLLLY